MSAHSSPRVPRRISSNLSLKRGAKSPSLRPSYFDVYPLPNSSLCEQHNLTDPHKHAFPTISMTPMRRGTKSSEEDSYAFPTLDSEGDTVTPAPKPYPRTRSRTSPSSKSNWTDGSSVPPLSFSASSTTQRAGTPPQTPVDFASYEDSFDNFAVVVAAPVAGVETMDALVDGMNGGDITQDFPSLLNRHRYGIPGHHPLYQPPLPTPPPGVVLGSAKVVRSKKKSLSSMRSSDSEGEDRIRTPSRHQRLRSRKTSSRVPSTSTLRPMPATGSHKAANPADDCEETLPATDPAPEKAKTVVPSISDIIRTHAPQLQSLPQSSAQRSGSMYAHSIGHTTVSGDHDYELESVESEQEADLVSRSSIDSVADEVQRTLRTQLSMKPPAAPPSSFPRRNSYFSDNSSLFSPRSDPGGTPSVYSLPVSSICPPPSPSEASHCMSTSDTKTTSQEIARYLRSARLTTLLKLTRSPHASQDNPLKVSLSDLGSQTGFPVVVFLGLGCVRHIMGLYDEMAEFLGLRLITIDRWGLGRTEPRSKSAKGIIQWASVVEEVLDLLRIGQCSIVAHSAGAPYALSFANKLPARIRGDVCLLAPWVGGSENSGYKWLKYVPNGLLRTAQAAEWRIQAWMIGKPPTITYEGIGYNAKYKSPNANGRPNPVYPSQMDSHSLSRPSLGSSSFSEYDDLGDFEGRFESRTTLGGVGHEQKLTAMKPKTSRGFLNRFKGSSPQDEKPPGKRLKALRSMGSLRGKSSTTFRKSSAPSPQLSRPAPLQLKVDLSLDDIDWTKSLDSELSVRNNSSAGSMRSNSRRSISFTPPKNTISLPTSPTPSATTFSGGHSVTSSNSPHMTLSTALIAASHAESSRGTHNDLLQILNHDNQPWGFSYSSYPHGVRLWYGDKDEKIAENAVRWMERTMGQDRCTVNAVRGGDHALMFNTDVVLEVFDYLLSTWRVSEPIGRRRPADRR